MTIESEIFKRYNVVFNKLIEYGFTHNKNGFYYTKLFNNNEFRMQLFISKSGDIQGKVYETASNDEFLPLRIERQQGAFVGSIREKYKQILTDIRDNCFYKSYFIFPQTNRIANAIISKYSDNPVFMWKNFPGFGVFKNSDNNKWYAAIMNIDYSKLGENSKEPVEIINLKLDKIEIVKLLKQNGFYPAWHMNKTSWITITLDDTLSDNKIMTFVEQSYSYTI